MQETFNFIISAIFQLTFVLILGYFFFFVSKIRNTTKSSFWLWIGLSPISPKLLFKSGLFLVYLPVFSVVCDFLIRKYVGTHLSHLNSTNSPFIRLWAMGWTPHGILSALFYSFIQTGTSEEILFRGLIGRKLIPFFGWWNSNFIQAFIFAGVHVLLFSISGVPMDLLFVITIFFMPFIFGFGAGLLNKKISQDSIYPSILAHGLTNFFAFSAYFIYQ